MMRLLLIGSLMFCLAACSKKQDDTPTAVNRHWVITKVQGDTTAARHAIVPITVSWPYTSGCDGLVGFSEERKGNIVSVTTFGRTSAGMCTMDAGIKTNIFNFSFPAAGSFELRFINPDSSVISHKITVL